ncbi:hypothetical protein SEA_ODAY_86 [Gordonia phage ODay]|nr:hypothetical protein SEA_ODAY_86 [Gordonia phage ODay]
MSDIGFGPVGDPPIVNHYPLKDGYGRTTPLVDRRLLEQAQAWAAWLLAEQEHEYEAALDGLESERDDPYSEANQAASAWKVVASHPLIGDISTLPERGSYAEMVRARLDEIAAERDHWRAEAEKARTRFNDLWAIHDATVTPDETVGPEQPVPGRKDCGVRTDGISFGAPCIRPRGHAGDYHQNDAGSRWSVLKAADRLESEATADDVVEKADPREVIEHAIRDSSAGPWLQLPGPVDLTPNLVTHIHEHLASAGLLRGDR